MPPRKQKKKEEEDQVEQSIVSTEPPPALTHLLDRTDLGTFAFDLHQTLFHPDSVSHLEYIAKAYELRGPRETTSAHLKRIRSSFERETVQTHKKPLVAVLAPEDWRIQHQLPDSQISSLDGSISYLARLRGSQSSSIPAEESVKLVLILLDGRAREKVLLEELARTEQKRTIFVKLHSADLLKDRQAFMELLHGTNFRHSFSALAVKPGLEDYLRSIDWVRRGDETAQLIGGVDSTVESWFYSYASSQSRTQIAYRALRDSMISVIAERELPRRISFWFGGFGAASPLLFSAIDDTLTAFNIIDPSRTILTVTFFWFLSKVILREDVPHPFGGLDLTRQEALDEVKRRCSDFAATLRKVAESTRTDGDVVLKKFTSYFGTPPPPWFAVAFTRLELAREIIGQLEALAARLDDLKVSDIDPESRFAEKFVIYEDLISLNPRSHGTEFTRWIALCESHVLTPLCELLSAYVQLSREDSSLRLPKQYEDTFKDLEPFLHELMLVGDGLKGIKATGRKLPPTEPWFEPKPFSDIYTALIRHLWIHHRGIILDVLTSKARLDSLSDDRRQTYLDSFLDDALQVTPQGEVIEKNLHLAFFRVGADRTLVPTLPPSSFEQCNAWLRPEANALLVPLQEPLETDNSSNLFASHLDLIKQDDRFPVRDSSLSLDNLVHDLVVKHTVRKNQNTLPCSLDTALSKLECFEPDPPARPQSPAPIAVQSPNDSQIEKKEEEEEQSLEGPNLEVAAEIKGDREGEESGTHGETNGRDDQEDEERGEDNRSMDSERSRGLSSVGTNGDGDGDGGEEEKEEGEVEEEEKISMARSKRGREKGKEVVRPLDRQSDSDISSHLRRCRRSSTLAAFSNSESGSFALDNSRILPRNADADDLKPNLRAITSSTHSTDPQKSAASLKKVFNSTSVVALEIVKRFRQSNRYPPLGTSFDPNTFRLEDFTDKLRDYLYERRGNGDEETEDEGEVELQGGFEPVRESILWSRIHFRTLDVFLGLLSDPTVAEDVYNFWEEFAWNVLEFD